MASRISSTSSPSSRGHSLPSLQMAENDPEQQPEPTRPTKPARGDPVENPVPKRSDWAKVLKRASKPVPQDEPLKDQGDPLNGA